MFENSFKDLWNFGFFFRDIWISFRDFWIFFRIFLQSRGRVNKPQLPKTNTTITFKPFILTRGVCAFKARVTCHHGDTVSEHLLQR